ncbi:MAG: hypothetical protein AAGA85_21590 [Bacteroidota bacterium]
MALTVLTIACFLLYATSKYFPMQGMSWIDRRKGLWVGIGSAMVLLSLYLFTLSYDFATALMFWMIAFMTLLSAIVVSVKLNYKSIWVWGGVCLLFVLIDLL